MATYNAKTLTITNNGDNYIIDPLQGNDVAYRDITVNIDSEDWTLSNNVYSYVWTNSYLTQNSQVQVYFKANVRGGLTGDLRVQKTTGQITFSTSEEPTDDISLLVRIIDANTTGILPINADMVETDAIVGETDVQGALEDLDERIRELSGGAGLEVSFSIPANGWSNSAPYEYTWRSSNLRAECTVEAEFYSGAENTDAIYFEYEKVDPETTGGNYGVKFTSPNKPASAVPVCVRINNAKAEAITSVNAEMVATDAISGAANVQEALSGLNSKLTEYSSGTFTPSMSGAVLTDYGSHWVRIGNFVYIQYQFASSNGVAANAIMDIYLPNELIPYVEYQTIGYGYIINSAKSLYCRLHSRGVHITNTTGDIIPAGNMFSCVFVYVMP